MTSHLILHTLLSRVSRISLCLLLIYPAITWATLPPGNNYLTDFESAVTEYDTRNYSAARIHLKNALQKRPDHLPSRLLLGKIALKMGEAPAAEKELLIALRLGAAKDQVVIPLGNALLLQRKHKEILETITLEGISNTGRYEVLTLRGRAHQELGELEEAHLDFDRAIAFNNSLKEAYLGKSRAFSSSGNYGAAEMQIDIALGRVPESPELLYEKASLRRRQGDAEAALEFYNQALEIRPNHMRARLGRASLNLSLSNLEAARDDAYYVHTAVPIDPDAALIYAQALGRLGEQEEARRVLQRAGDNLSRFKDEEILEQPGLLRIAALISLQQGATERANGYLDRYLVLVPHELRMRKISARVKLQLGDGKGAARVLGPYYNQRTKDAEVLRLMGEAYLASGDFLEAQIALEQAASLQSDLPNIDTLLALSKIGSGDTETAQESLSEANSAPSNQSLTAGIVLAITETRAGDFDKAHATVEGLLKRQPENPILLNLAGIISLGVNDLNRARTAFEQALAKNPSFIPAMYNMGQLEQKTGQIDAAEEWFNRIVQVDPDQSNALSALAEIAVIRGDYTEAVSLLRKATTGGGSGEIAPHLRLVEIYLILGDITAAQAQATALESRYPENAQATEVASRVELAAGNREKAIKLLRRASRYADRDGPMLIKIADQLILLEEYQSGRRTLDRATLTDEKLAAYERLVELYLKQREVSKARSLTLLVQQAEPDMALGHRLEGRVLQSEGKYEDAISQYQTALKIQQDRDTLLELYELYFLLGNMEGGFQLLEAWVQDHPGDTIAQRNLALGYLRANRRQESQAMLEQLVAARPNDSLVLASLAQLYQQEGNPKALSLAESAFRAAPEWGVALDTYGWALVSNGNAEAGLKYLREAVTRDSNPLIRYHLAAALYNLGRNSEAESELEAILRLSNKPPWIDSAQKLYDMINTPG